MIVLESNLMAEDYDTALVQPSRVTQWLLMLFQVVVAGVVLATVLPSMALLFSALATTFNDPAKLAHAQRAGVLRWALPTIVVLIPFTLWFLWYLVRLTLRQFSLTRRPRDLRELRAGVCTGPARYVVNVDGVRIEMRDARRFLPWSAFAEALDAPGRIRLMFRRDDGGKTLAGIFVPARLFASDEDRREFVRVANLFIREQHA